MKPLRLLQWLLGSLLGLGFIVIAVVVIMTPFVFGLLWPPPRPHVDSAQPLPTAEANSPTASETPVPAPSPESARAARVIEGDGLRVRNRPDREAETLEIIAFDEVVTLLERSPDGEWVKVRTQNNVEGWVLAFGIQEQQE